MIDEVHKFEEREILNVKGHQPRSLREFAQVKALIDNNTDTMLNDQARINRDIIITSATSLVLSGSTLFDRLSSKR
jgi:arsenate reductase-like glutaredoxin family protein